jgi:hypothetical protein
MAARPQMRHQVETNEHVVLDDDDAVVAHGAAVSSCFVRDAVCPPGAGQPTFPGLTQTPRAQHAAFCRLSQVLRGRQFGDVSWRCPPTVFDRRGNADWGRARAIERLAS